MDNLSPDQIRAYILADNKLAELAGWDEATLAIELQHLTSVDLDFDISLTGFEVAEIDLLVRESASPEEEEAVVISPDPAITQPGDVWLLGSHRLLCGDALDESAYSPLMNGESADVVFTDPPYNVRIDGNVCGKGAIRHREFAMASGEMSEGPLLLGEAHPAIIGNAKDYFTQAIGKDSNYALAYVGLADYYNVLPDYAPASVRNRCASGHFSTSCSIACVSSAIMGVSRSNNSSRSRRRRCRVITVELLRSLAMLQPPFL